MFPYKLINQSNHLQVFRYVSCCGRKIRFSRTSSCNSDQNASNSIFVYLIYSSYCRTDFALQSNSDYTELTTMTNNHGNDRAMRCLLFLFFVFFSIVVYIKKNDWWWHTKLRSRHLFLNRHRSIMNHIQQWNCLNGRYHFCIHFFSLLVFFSNEISKRDVWSYNKWIWFDLR